VEEDRGRQPLGIGWAPRAGELGVDLLGVSRLARHPRGDVGLDHLLEGRPVEPAGQVFHDRWQAQVDVVGVDQLERLRPALPEPAHHQGQQAQRAARALEVGDSGHP
jgi:hypothetical protein